MVFAVGVLNAHARCSTCARALENEQCRACFKGLAKVQCVLVREPMCGTVPNICARAIVIRKIFYFSSFFKL